MKEATLRQSEPRSPFRWRKLGHLYTPQGEAPWLASHAANPFAEHRSGDIFRVYCSSRDSENRAHIMWVDVDIATMRVEGVAEKPLLGPGTVGTFDDSGTSLGWITDLGDRTVCYYLGWNLSVTVPWRNSIGLAVFNKTRDALERLSLAPLLDRNSVDPYSISYPCVLKTKTGFTMWYGSNRSWGREASSMDHVIKIAHSTNGIDWSRHGTVALDHHEGEYAISKPCVREESFGYSMWYSYRGDAYRIGYAESPDRTSWTRLDDLAGIDPSIDDWDRTMVCYPFVFDHNGARYMLYNGDGYGKTGFGLAILEEC